MIKGTTSYTGRISSLTLRCESETYRRRRLILGTRKGTPKNYSSPPERSITLRGKQRHSLERLVSQREKEGEEGMRGRGLGGEQG